MTTALGRDHPASSRPRLWRISERRTFAELRTTGRRCRRGPLTVTWLPLAAGAPVDPPRVALAIGRSAGSAVVRNRIRRRLRAGLRELQLGHRLPPGAYLLSGGAALAQLPWVELVAALDSAVAGASSEGGR
ncbi:MAG: ribonuclease P protein component [Terracoccus sp.]